MFLAWCSAAELGEHESGRQDRGTVSGDDHQLARALHACTLLQLFPLPIAQQFAPPRF